VQPPTDAEARAAADRAGTNKGIGPCGVPYDIVKLPGVAEHLNRIAFGPAFLGNPPAAWRTSFTTPLHKGGPAPPDPLDALRPVTLSCCPSKLSNACILKRLAAGLDDPKDPVLRPNQNGFRRGRATTQSILALQRILDLAVRSGKPTAVLFVDYNDAFNSVYWHKIREVLEQLGVPQELITAVMALMDNVTTRVETPAGLTAPIDVWAGVLQGDTLAPFIFICVIDVIMRRATENHPGISFVRADGTPATLTDLNYADDLAIVFEARPGTVLEEEIARFIATLARISAEYGLTINFKPKKTEILYLNCNLGGDTTALDKKSQKGIAPNRGVLDML